jgi:hypothetical protein
MSKFVVAPNQKEENTHVNTAESNKYYFHPVISMFCFEKIIIVQVEFRSIVEAI